MRRTIAMLAIFGLGLGDCTPAVVARDSGSGGQHGDAAADANHVHDGAGDAVAPTDRAPGPDQQAGRDAAPGSDHAAGTDTAPGVDHNSGVDSAVGVDHCTPDCTSKYCGDDNGCGGRCLSCANGNERCNSQSWTCSAVCVPDCTSKYCGDSDGCSGTCTACQTAGQGCNPGTGTCSSCTLDCGPGGSCFYGLQGVQECQCGSGYYHNLSAQGCAPATGTACDGIDCGGRGTCITFWMGGTSCSCNPGYLQWSNACLPENRMGCRDRDNSYRERGSTRCSLDDATIEVCRDGNGDGLMEWSFGATPSCGAGNTCSACIGANCDVANGGQACPLERTCVPEAHQTPLWACGTACDCTNCGDCGSSSSCFGGWQAFCGNCSTQPATIACNAPCPSAGDGCIPWPGENGVVGLCWGMEGCFSAVPAW